MFIGAIVIAGNGARPNIYIRSHFSVAYITQVINLAMFANNSFFYFNKITDFTVLA